MQAGSRNAHRLSGHAKSGGGGTSGKKIPDGVGRNSERKRPSDHRVDSHHPPAGVSKRPAGIARREADAGLNPQLRAEATNRAHGMNHAGGEGADET